MIHPFSPLEAIVVDIENMAATEQNLKKVL